jgi:hypothetical protein
MSDSLSRRELLGATAAVSLTGLLDPSPSYGAAVKTMRDVPFERHSKIRIGFVGIGGRGSGLLNDLLHIPDVAVTAVCDLRPAAAQGAAKRVTDAGQPQPAVFQGGEREFEKLCARDDIDLVYTATPWDWHVPVALSAMEHGKHVAVEVPAATTLADCWKLVDTSEKTRRHCIQLENCCYGWSELLVLNAARAGLFGTLTHAECAYIHDLRGLLLEDAGEGLWRRFPHIRRNGNLYPTHGLGPVARYFDINRGDRFVFQVSVASREASLTEFRDRAVTPDSPKRKEAYRCGDMSTSILKTEQGRTVMLQHDVVTPRPYSRINLVQGTKGTFADYPARIFVDGGGHGDWASLDGYKDRFEHPLWKKEGDTARQLGGHGGMDYLMSFRLIQCLREGLVPDMDVYDAAAWSAPGPLSELSASKNSASVPFPDFTRGNWQIPARF